MLAKAQEYMTRTKAYRELTTRHCPLTYIFRTVQILLDYVVKSHGLTEAQRRRLCPKVNKLELAHYHGIPKTHKVTLFSFYPIYFTTRILYVLFRKEHLCVL